MDNIQVRFVTSNPFKAAEAQEILGPIGVRVVPIEMKIEELQTTDTHRLVRDKAVRAFANIARPLFVEHTGLYLKYMNDLPGGLTQIVWDALQADRFSELFGKSPDPRVTAKTTIGYIDGKKVHIFLGEISGRVAAKPIGNRDFQWDCVFVPDGETETFAQMGSRKNKISMRRRALDQYAAFLQANR